MELSFSGGASVRVNLFSIRDATFQTDEFLKVVEWSFKFSISLGKTFTLLDFLTAGVGGGALNALAEYIGLDAITITIKFTLSIEIVKRAATASEPETATFSLSIGITVTIHIGLNIIIAELTIDVSLAITLTFFQDLAKPSPMRIFLDLIVTIKVKIRLLFITISPTFTWHPINNQELTSGSEVDDAKMGPDADMDGLSDEYEKSVPGLNPNSKDTDGDGLSDRMESQFSNTDPTRADTDGDGLNDKMEYETTKTNPRLQDTDSDGLTDYEEAIIYGTNPLAEDTDNDGLSDYYEINHAWDISKVTPSVTKVIIGGQEYNDRTDPLDPDTDDDGLLDGQEGPFGPYYGPPELYNGTDEQNGIPPLIFNDGYTHPLDNDTDDDGRGLQLWNGTLAIKQNWPYTLTDGEEVQGVWVVFINATTGEPERRLIRTNPVNPDTDGDTGRDGSVPSNQFLNSDGYELSLNPPSDPTDADTDDDGLIDGLEGTLRYDSNYTHYNNPDTDGDGLGDLQELLLGTDPRHPDTDLDLIPDGVEVYTFGTNPFINDTDQDGLLDGEETYFYHTNPHLPDSDADGIRDGQEVKVYFTDPMDEDTDNDWLNDYEEIFFYGTDPFVNDTDQDGLLDGEELITYKTDPLLWDTDNDTIWYLDENGNVTFGMSDGQEVLYGTNNTNPDTDGDGISDGWELYLASGKVPNYRVVNLNATNNDTDQDGFLDGVELVIANRSSIIYPYIAFYIELPFNTAPDNPDTDGDGLTDFEEVVRIDVSKLVNPSVIDTVLVNETDQSGNITATNIKTYVLGTDPANNDTDNDTLSDYYEVVYHGTSPTEKDTDGDGLPDNQEYTLVGNGTITSVPAGVYEEYNLSNLYTTNLSERIYPTSALDPDSDDDLLPDGAEVSLSRYVWTANLSAVTIVPNGSNVNLISGLTYTVYYSNNGKTYANVTNNTATYIISDPLNADQNNNSILDGLEFDADYDGLQDGYEFSGGTVYLYYKNKNVDQNATLEIDPPPIRLSEGGPTNPDSDKDGLIDGIEVYKYQTNVSNYDTDGDGWSDGLEIRIGTDPLNYTDNSTIFTKIGEYVNSTLLIVSPMPTNYESGQSVPVIVKPSKDLQLSSVWYRWRAIGEKSWSNNISMQYNSKLDQWEDLRVAPWRTGIYILEVYGIDQSGALRISRIKFSIGISPLLFSMNNPVTLASLFFAAVVSSFGLAYLGSLIANKLSLANLSGLQFKTTTSLNNTLREIKYPMDSDRQKAKKG